MKIKSFILLILSFCFVHFTFAQVPTATVESIKFKNLQEKFKNDFKVLAQEILEKNSTTIKEQNKEQIGIILSPFKEKLESFEKKVEESLLKL